MNIATISPHSYQLTRFGLFNCYLVLEDDGYTLVDTGLPGSAEAILQAARSLKVAEISRILLTHAHGDHIGSLDKLSHLLGNVEVAISQRDARLLPKPPAQDRSLDAGEPQSPLKGGFPGAVTAPTHFVTEGELYGSLRCLATPGHTPGHFSFFDERDGTLYVGDEFVTVGGELHIAGFGPWFFPLPAMATWHKPTCLASAHRLLSLKLPIQHIAAGHGRLMEGGHEALTAAIRHAEHSLHGHLANQSSRLSL